MKHIRLRLGRQMRFNKRQIGAGSWALADKVCGVCQRLQRVFQRTIYYCATWFLHPFYLIFFKNSQYLYKLLSSVLHFFLLIKTYFCYCCCSSSSFFIFIIFHILFHFHFLSSSSLFSFFKKPRLIQKLIQILIDCS